MAAELLAGVEVLLAAARSGSATRAASTLGTTEQAEAAASRMKGEVEGLEKEPVGTVRLALLPGLSSIVVAPALVQLRARYSRLTLELAPASAIVDLVRREADLALRTVRPEIGDLVIQRVAAFRLAVMCSPALLARGRRVRLRHLPWVTWTDELSMTPEAEWLRENVPDAPIALRSPELQTLICAAQAGLGAVVVAEPLGIAAGGLLRVPTRARMPEGALWLVAHRALRPVPRVAAVWEWLASLIAGVAAAADQAR